ncbi:MAG: DegT/DnrJ/EryC1/StrS family aminotransferase [Fibrobacteres bacterium]|nr:DegT/DnrJ/EryC1/StrS family aminotransferase [Fibrobacterota bacterium]
MQFCDLGAQYRAYQSEIDEAVASVLASGAFIHGPDVAALETELAAFSGAPAVCACANGSDAILACLHALGLEMGDEVIVPDFTFFATAEMVVRAGARPAFADIDAQTFLVTPQSIEAAITPRTRGILAVSLFGQMPDFVGIRELAERRGLWVVEDAAQSFGAKRDGVASTNATVLAATSFYPSKPLGCYGDGGAVFGEESLVEKARIFCNHGQTGRGLHGLAGINSRLDSLQATILRVKLRHFPQELARRSEIATAYSQGLGAVTSVPALPAECASSWAQYTLRVKDRDRVRSALFDQGIPTMVHYPSPLHRQAAFAEFGNPDDLCPQSIRAASEVLSLPMHAFVSQEEVERVVDVMKQVLTGRD